jgi:uncharacterized metal-binding protein
VGQLSNKIAIELEKKGIGNLMCTVGIGAKSQEMIKSAESSDRVIAVDGCPLQCASKTLESAGIKPDKEIIISEFGIKKNKNRDLKNEEVCETLEKTLEFLKSE